MKRQKTRPYHAESVGEAAAFDPATFASILMKEVDAISRAKYGNTSPNSRRKAFRFWSVKNLSPLLVEQGVDSAVASCETGSRSEMPIEAAWIQDGTVTFLQTAFLPIRIPTDPEEELVLDLFPADSLTTLSDMLSKVLLVYQGTTTNPSPKLSALAGLYGQAVTNSWHVRLVTVISGTPSTDILRTREKMNAQFRSEATLPVKPFVRVVDFGELNEIVSEHLGGHQVLNRCSWCQSNSSTFEKVGSSWR